ncbi:Ca2+-binding protein, RTX toxin-related [Rhizobium tibeticum]|uniref:Ca2+-binding protein, RTX toxin-related n=2 Tax=Rhizobium tibeticum TaxID=501024 RepID=A0A1H8UGM7_9HYPH|nr:Cyclolysin [Rhizobium tibeticum]SEP02379.1 Ca2+-binding protein, RTX toxin-related [Rhizobium tibeticum]
MAMEEKLVLGLPNDGKSIVAPANAFRLSEKEPHGRVKYGMLPALVVGVVGAELAGSDENNAGQQLPLLQDDVTADHAPPAEVSLSAIEDAAAFLRQLAAEIAAQGNPAPTSSSMVSVKLSFAGGGEPYSSSIHMNRLVRAFNDNDGRIPGDGDSYRFPANVSYRPGPWPSPDHPNGGQGGLPDWWSDFGSDANPDPRTDDPPADDVDDDRINRLPISAGRSRLPDTMMNLSALILLDDLLALVHDPDGDPLSITDIGVSAGKIEAYGPGRWLYTPNRGALGEVTFTYRVSDRTGDAVAKASMDLVRHPPVEISGTDGDDRLLGTPHEDIIDGKDGNDVIYGRESDDVISGGRGQDTVLGGDGADIIYAGAGRDIIFGGGGDDVMFGEDGDDDLYGEDGSDTLVGREGHDRLVGGAGDDRLFGDGGDDVLVGGIGNDLLEGGAGNDDLSGGGGADTVFGNAGNDIVHMGLERDESASQDPDVTDGDDAYFGGEGVDTIDASAGRSGIAIDLMTGSATGTATGSDRIDGFENVSATAYDDVITGDDAANLLHGGAGDDVLIGGESDDLIDAGEGDDIVQMAPAAPGSDDGDDEYDGGDGVDTLDLGALLQAVLADIEERYVEGEEVGRDTIVDFEIIRGGGGNDHLKGGQGSDILHGAAGNDRLVGRGDDDILVGGDGHDHIEGNDGDDIYVVVLSADLLSGSDGDDTFDGGSGLDSYDATSTRNGVTIDLVSGTASGEEIGTDHLANVEIAIGGSGNDVLVDAGGVTVLAGGDGSDVFIFAIGSVSGNIRDEIRDFATGDKIDFSALGSHLFFGGLSIDDDPRSGSITFHYRNFEDAEQTVVRTIIDLEHDDDIEILLHGHHDLTERDFVLAVLDLTTQENQA